MCLYLYTRFCTVAFILPMSDDSWISLKSFEFRNEYGYVFIYISMYYSYAYNMYMHIHTHIFKRDNEVIRSPPREYEQMETVITLPG